MFQSTPSGGKATPNAVRVIDRQTVSIHAFRGEGDRLSASSIMHDYLFQSTPSGGKATQQALDAMTELVFQSTPSGGKATRNSRRTARQ